MESVTSRADARRNREIVIEAALELLARQPTASMAAIATHSGLGRTTVYRHFPSREDLIRALFVHVVAESQRVTSEVIESDDGVEQRLQALGPAIVGIGARFQFLAGARELGDEVIHESTLNPDDPVRRFLTEAQASGEVREDVPVQWMLTSINALASAAMIELGSGRVGTGDAGRLLGEAFVRCFGV